MKPKSKKMRVKRPASEMTESKQTSDNIPGNSETNSNSNGVSKKKKKKATEGEKPIVGENKASKRQMKREKHAERLAEAETNSHKAVQQQALSYLSLWKHNKAEWKFNKVKQIWLHKHKFDKTKIPEELWRPFVEYFSSSTGGIKQLIISDSKKVIEEMEAWIEKNAEASNPEDKPSELAYQRARDLIQNIQE